MFKAIGAVIGTTIEILWQTFKALFLTASVTLIVVGISMHFSK